MPMQLLVWQRTLARAWLLFTGSVLETRLAVGAGEGFCVGGAGWLWLGGGLAEGLPGGRVGSEVQVPPPAGAKLFGRSSGIHAPVTVTVGGCPP